MVQLVNRDALGDALRQKRDYVGKILKVVFFLTQSNSIVSSVQSNSEGQQKITNGGWGVSAVWELFPHNPVCSLRATLSNMTIIT